MKPLMLASVRTLEEAHKARDWGADILDFKEPKNGSLGALPIDEIKKIVDELSHQATPIFSVTVGDLPLDPQIIFHAVEERLDVRPSWIKVGFAVKMPGSSAQNEKNREDVFGCVQRLMPLAKHQALIAVIFAEAPPPLAWLPVLAKHGFAGVLADTQNKNGQGLCQLWNHAKIEEFVHSCHQLHLLCGLAGQLKACDIAQLVSLRPDVLGFRSALCDNGQRTDNLNEEAFQRVKGEMVRAV